MLSERELKDVIEKIIGEIKVNEPVTAVEEKAPVVSTSSVYIESGDEPRENPHIVNGEVRDIGQINIKDQMLVDNPEDREEYMKLKQKNICKTWNWKSWNKNENRSFVKIKSRPRCSARCRVQ